jgi:hypothetical protein
LIDLADCISIKTDPQDTVRYFSIAKQATTTTTTTMASATHPRDFDVEAVDEPDEGMTDVVKNQFGLYNLGELEEELAQYIVFRLPNVRKLSHSVAGEFPHSIYETRAPMTKETKVMCKLNLAHCIERVANAIAEVLVENPRNVPQTVTIAHVEHAIQEFLSQEKSFGHV